MINFWNTRMIGGLKPPLTPLNPPLHRRVEAPLSPLLTPLSTGGLKLPLTPLSTGLKLPLNPPLHRGAEAPLTPSPQGG